MDDAQILDELDTVPALFVTEAGIGTTRVVTPDGDHTHRVLRLYQPEGAIDLVMTEAVAREVGLQLAAPLPANTPVGVDLANG